jgi:iron complex transport system substrate-binding protein
MKTSVFYIILLCFLISCKTTTKDQHSTMSIESSDSVKYAKGFTITAVGEVKVLSVFNPWEGAQGVVYKYVLCPREVKVPDSLKKYQIIFTPVQRIVCLSTTHVALLSFFDRVNTIVGLASPQYVSNKEARQLVTQGKILDVGYDQALNYEVIVSLKPDLVLAYGIQSETAGQFKKLENLGIKVVLNGEYLEASPLGKLEWVKFLAAFYGLSKEATSEFTKVEKRYLELQHLGEGTTNKPTILCGLPWKGVWYVPGGDSYAARIIKDAGATYLWNESNQRESLSLNFEKVIERANNADIWINTGTSVKLKDILAEDARLGTISAFKQKEVYNCNALTNSTGGNDFWESGIVHPDVILADLIKICHPQLLPDQSLVYYKKLE